MNNIISPTQFDNSYARLPERFYARLNPTPVSAPKLIRLNHKLARELGMDVDALLTDEGTAVLAGNSIPEGADPIAMAYAGHQFGGWSPQLGDGRAILLGEVLNADKQRRDIQLKGSGPTPFSRRGDGRAGIGPVIREYIVSEAMAALGIPTTRALAAVSTGDYILREGQEPGAVITRVARSHIRVGTFEFFASRNDIDGLRLLADHVIDRHYPYVSETDNPYAALLDAVMDRQIKLIAQWQGVGFIHGVMNTDNMSISGDTIDYGPCAFMDNYEANKVFSSIDQQGRYSYQNQTRIAQWNLAVLAQALLPLIHDDEAAAIIAAQSIIDTYPARLKIEWTSVMSKKIGLGTKETDDALLIEDLLAQMEKSKADFTQTFRGLCLCGRDDEPKDSLVSALFSDKDAFTRWFVRWKERLNAESTSDEVRLQMMKSANPAYIPRNHRIQAAIVAATNEDYTLFEEMVEVLARPYEDQPAFKQYQEPPLPEQVVQQTFCGT